jgi:TolA-binding protein
MKSAMLKLTIITLIFPLLTFAQSEKGLLPEIRLTDNENENQNKALKSEIMITRTENKAIESLQTILKKQKGSPNEADLWYRLGELYMRRSKSGRFFDLNKETPLLKLSTFPIPKEKGSESIKRAIKIYTKIETDFPKFKQLDSVLFNNAFASQQVGNIKNAEILYTKLRTQFPNSNLIPDGILALGEIHYEQGHFALAINQFKALEKFPNSRGFSFGVYKAAWAYYNMHENQKGIEKLVEVIKSNPPLLEGETPTNRHNLHEEALRDLALFAGETVPASRLYTFFESITTDDELGPSMLNVVKIYESHSRHKEISIFLKEYLEKRNTGDQAVMANIALVDANENLKLRDNVIEHLDAAIGLCKKDSTWRALQKPKIIQKSCTEDLHHATIDISKKWLEIWTKNRTNETFSILTMKLFKMILENEDFEKPDIRTRFAFAEMLFHSRSFEESSEQYKLVGSQCDLKTDSALCHDADYSALFSKEKSIEKEKTTLKLSDRKELALNYIKKYPKGKFSEDIQFKLAHIAYEENDLADSKKWLQTLLNAKSISNEQLKVQSEDLFLDILNIEKDFSGIAQMAKKLLQSTTSPERKASMTKIAQETQFAEIQEFAKTGKPEDSALKLIAYSAEYMNSTLSKDALWQAIGIYYQSENLALAADLSEKYISKYPNDSRNILILKDTTKAYTEIGRLEKSAEALIKLAQLEPKNRTSLLESSADIYSIENKKALARSTYLSLVNALPAGNEKTESRIYGKILDTYNDEKSSPELLKLQEKIQSKGLEPFTTRFMIDKARKYLEAGKIKAAFDLSMKANSRSSPSEIRAEARLIQAEILEKELTQQSVKSSVEKFAMVLSLKTEKLDKAQSAFLSAMKMSKDPKQQFSALQGIDRCYQNYLDSLKSISLPSALSADEQKQLKTELEKITVPIEKKKNENEVRIETIKSSIVLSQKTTRSYASFGLDKSVDPEIIFPDGKKLNVFFPAGVSKETNMPTRLDIKNCKDCIKKLCNKSSISSLASLSGDIQGKIGELAGTCYQFKQFDLLLSLGLELAKDKAHRSDGLFYLSLASEGQGLNTKAIWMIDSALKKVPGSGLYLYQKARLTYLNEGPPSASKLFEKLLDMKLHSTELTVFAGIKSFSDRDFTTAIEHFSALTKEQLYTFNVGLLMSESLAQKGDADKAINLVNELISLHEKSNKKTSPESVNELMQENLLMDTKNKSVGMILQKAHLYEQYKVDSGLALNSYEGALKINSTNRDLQNWLTKKIEHLKSQNKLNQNFSAEATQGISGGHK